MKPKITIVLILVMLSLSCLTSVSYIEICKASDPPTFYVDDDNTAGPWDGSSGHPYRYIQDAINAASPGNRIKVLEGTYSENLVISSNKTSLDLFGEDKSITTITGGGSGDVITISATGVDLSDFTIKSSGSGSTNAAIKLNASNCVIVGNIISNNKHGFYIYDCNNIKIYYNTITNNIGNGIYLENSSYNSITYTTIKSSSYNGFFLYSCSNNKIENCSIMSNSKNGIYLNATCNNNIIANNYISSNTQNGIYLNDHCNNNIIKNNNGNNGIYSNSDSGIRLENSSSNNLGNNIVNGNSDYGIMVLGSNNSIHNTTINSNTKHGVFLFGDDNNNVIDNNIQENTKDGIRIQNSTNDKIYGNEISGNSQYGIYLNYYSVDNLIYNNYFHDNSDNAFDMSENNNIWSISTTTGYNIVNGENQNVSGNYWDDFDEVSEGAVDSNGSGVVDVGISKSINISSSDTGAIVDLIDPVIVSISISPSTQTIGGYTYISADITDNTKIKDARLIVTAPNGVTSNFSIVQNKTGDTYYCNKQFSPVGTYKIVIAGKDPRNWVTSNTQTFYIDEGAPPAITDNSLTTGSPSNFFIFNATVTDDEDSVSDLTVKVHWSHGGYGGNYSMGNICENYFHTYVYLDNSTDSLSYSFYACDQWGNSRTTEQKTVSIVDNKPPTISIDTYGASSDDLPNSYTFRATITDDTEVDEASIEYWYEGSDHKTVEMDKKTNNKYEKVIIINENPSTVYCIIYATDPSGNQNDTKKPFANASGPYSGVIGIGLTFDATNSFDLDGTIANYSWDFGDGTTGFMGASEHTYSTNGNYTITLTITDNDGNKDIDVTYVNIISLTQKKTSYTTMSEIEDDYGITLTDLFYGYDIDGDKIADTFVDPNNVLKAVHTGNINISGNITFLLSVDDSNIPEFMWNTTTDEIVPIYHRPITIDDSDIEIDEENEQATVDITVEKANWIYIDINDIYPYATIVITTENRTIPIDRIWRKNDKIYVLDDPSTEYTITFQNIYPTVESPTFIPGEGALINENSKTITVIYTVPVTITYATFDTIRVESKLTTTDNKVFTYTPPGYLEDGVYTLEISAKALQGDNQGSFSSTYIFQQYTSPPPVPQKSFIEKNFIWILLGIFAGVGAVIFLIIRYQLITFESFIYIKNKKIIPFFKPLVFGPLRIDVNDKKVKKAEFYVNGKLKDTISQKPFIWDWNEPAFMKKTIETKIFDEDGNSSSSGEMTFFVFNSPRFFK